MALIELIYQRKDKKRAKVSIEYSLRYIFSDIKAFVNSLEGLDEELMKIIEENIEYEEYGLKSDIFEKIINYDIPLLTRILDKETDERSLDDKSILEILEICFGQDSLAKRRLKDLMYKINDFNAIKEEIRKLEYFQNDEIGIIYGMLLNSKNAYDNFTDKTYNSRIRLKPFRIFISSLNDVYLMVPEVKEPFRFY